DDGRIGLEMFDIICIHDSLFRRLIQVGLPPALHGDLGHAEDGDTEQGCDQPCYEERFLVDRAGDALKNGSYHGYFRDVLLLSVIPRFRRGDEMTGKIILILLPRFPSDGAGSSNTRPR